MAVSGSRNWIANRNDIIYAALRKLGVKAEDNPATAEEVQAATFALNAMVLGWQNDGVRLWTIAEELITLAADTASYALSSSIVEVINPIFRQNDSDEALTIYTREEYYGISDKKQSGDPIGIYVDYQLANPTAYVWPVPETETTIVTGTDANKYICIQDHTSSTDDTPITGSDYATYWEATSATANTVWADDTDYYSRVIRYTKVLRLQDFDAAADDPDFPVRWTKALVYGLASDLAPEYSIPLNERGDLAQRFMAEYGAARRMDYDATDLIVVPSRR